MKNDSFKAEDTTYIICVLGIVLLLTAGAGSAYAQKGKMIKNRRKRGYMS